MASCSSVSSQLAGAGQPVHGADQVLIEGAAHLEAAAVVAARQGRARRSTSGRSRRAASIGGGVLAGADEDPVGAHGVAGELADRCRRR